MLTRHDTLAPLEGLWRRPTVRWPCEIGPNVPLMWCEARYARRSPVGSLCDTRYSPIEAQDKKSRTANTVIRMADTRDAVEYAITSVTTTVASDRPAAFERANDPSP